MFFTYDQGFDVAGSRGSVSIFSIYKFSRALVVVVRKGAAGI
jgi:hypothetical protein